MSSSILAVQEKRWGTLPQEEQLTAFSVKDYGLVGKGQLVDPLGPSLEEQQAVAGPVLLPLVQVGQLACCGQV